jgi:hypothetical protein
MKATITVNAVKNKNTDVSPQVIILVNDELVDEYIFDKDGQHNIDIEFEPRDGWNEVQAIIGDLAFNDGDEVAPWVLYVENFTIDDADTFPIKRGEGLAPFMMKFNGSDLVMELENYDKQNGLDHLYFDCVADRGIIKDCAIGVRFEITDEQVTDFHLLNQDQIISGDTLNITTSTFIKLLRLSVKKVDTALKLDDYFIFNSTSTAAKYWGLPIVLQKVESDSMIGKYIIGHTWGKRTKVFTQYRDKNITAEVFDYLFTPPGSGQ